MGVKLKTLIVIDNLHTGGVATSLYNFLKFTSQQMQCDLLVFNEDSVDYGRLPRCISVIKPQSILHLLGKNQKEMKEKSRFLAFLRGVMFLIARFINGPTARAFLWLFVRRIGEYDYCVAYAQDDGWKSLSKGCMDFVIKKVISKKKSVVIHCDYKHFGGFHPKQLAFFQQLDIIICVSESCRSSFLDCFPSLAYRTIVCENFTDISYIKDQAGIGVPFDKTIINFVTVCRISRVKGIERVILAIKRLVEEDYKGFHWRVIGGGPELEALSRQVIDLGLDPYITFVGEKKNPYPYIVNSDWFVLPSYHEAAPMVFGESAALNVPILSTETCSAKELVSNRGWGIVVDNNQEGLYYGMKRILIGEFASFAIMDSDVNKNATIQFNSLVGRLSKL